MNQSIIGALTNERIMTDVYPGKVVGVTQALDGTTLIQTIVLSDTPDHSGKYLRPRTHEAGSRSFRFFVAQRDGQSNPCPAIDDLSPEDLVAKQQADQRAYRESQAADAVSAAFGA